MDDDRGYPYDSGNLLTQLAIEYLVGTLVAIGQFTFQTIFQIEIEDNWLVVWNIFLFSHILGISSSQLTFIFFRGVAQPPTR